MEALNNLITNYLAEGKLLHLSTSANAVPWVTHVWYAFDANSGDLVFTSNKARRHSLDIVQNSQVAGGVVAIDLEGLGQKVRGLSFEGHAFEAQDEVCQKAYDIYAQRWPVVKDMFSATDILNGTTGMRMFRVELGRAVLFDEVNFPDNPRQESILTR